MKLLEISLADWQALIVELRQHGRGKRESGAFLLGTRGDGIEPRKVMAWLNYEKLDPQCSKYDYIRIGTQAFPKLWNYCSQEGFQVVADVHTHPWGPSQSISDRQHPMVSIEGHLALIVPNFAYGDIAPDDVSLNVYQGSGQWISHYGKNAASRIQLT